MTQIALRTHPTQYTLYINKKLFILVRYNPFPLQEKKKVEKNVNDYFFIFCLLCTDTQFWSVSDFDL